MRYHSNATSSRESASDLKTDYLKGVAPVSPTSIEMGRIPASETGVMPFN